MFIFVSILFPFNSIPYFDAHMKATELRNTRRFLSQDNEKSTLTKIPIISALISIKEWKSYTYNNFKQYTNLVRYLKLLAFRSVRAGLGRACSSRIFVLHRQILIFCTVTHITKIKMLRVMLLFFPPYMNVRGSSVRRWRERFASHISPSLANERKLFFLCTLCL